MIKECDVWLVKLPSQETVSGILCKSAGIGVKRKESACKTKYSFLEEHGMSSTQSDK